MLIMSREVKKAIRLGVGVFTITPLLLVSLYGVMLVNELIPATEWITLVAVLGGVYLGVSKH